jgi:hypothetical protein
MLVSLPSLGMVTWRCDPEGKPGLAPQLPGLALGFRASRIMGPANVRLHAGGRTLSRRVVQPGDDAYFPWLRLRVQQLDISQFSGAGTLRAFVKVNFVLPATATYCYSYLPPRVDVRLLPRQ